MQVIQLFPDTPLSNYNYIIANYNSAYVVDPYDAGFVDKELKSLGLKCLGVINTHDHWDHTCGNQGMRSIYTDLEIYCHKNSIGVIPEASKGVVTGDRVNLGPEIEIEFQETPGHTESHICLFIKKRGVVESIVTGDTLFNAGVGNCKNGGNPNDLFETIRDHFLNLNDSVAVYPGHDYIRNNLRFTLSVEKDNEYAKNLLEKLENSSSSKCDYITTIGEEKKMNAFFRLNSSSIRQSLNLSSSSDREVFIKLRSLRDKW